MITEITEEKLVVFSDLHLGNPFCSTKDTIIDFMQAKCNEGFNLVLNGDGLDIMQTSFISLARDVPEVFTEFRRYTRKDLKVYYVVGNHDLILEQFLEDWGNFIVTPFLNVNSGDRRIRVEHGHLYDPVFVRYPNAYETLTRLAGLPLHLFPGLYRGWLALEKVINRGKATEGGIAGEAKSISNAARAILERGFDDVIFGHTHHPGTVEVRDGQHYYNTGSWLNRSKYCLIDNGAISLETWED